MKTVLTIAGSDPTGGAGLQADLKVFRSFGIHGLSVVSAVTAQNTIGVEAISPVERSAFEEQITVLLSDITPDAVKIGMLYSTWSADILAALFSTKRFANVVIDPVTVSSSGRSLVEEGALDIIRSKLFPISRVVTPNVYEATVLTGIAIDSRHGMEEAARSLKSMGPEVVIITGGHLEGSAIDLCFDGTFHAFESEKIRGEFHGTGCAFSSALTSLLVLGHPPVEAAARAKEFVRQAMLRAHRIGRGMAVLDL